MRVVVVGAGVMGLSAAKVLAVRGHDVVAIDRYGVGNAMASSRGATRIWRIAHQDRPRVRLAKWNLDLWRALESEAGRPLRLERGLLWRGGQTADVVAALAAEDVAHVVVDAAMQSRLFPELRWQPGRPVIWQPEAGIVLAEDALRVCAEQLRQHGGVLKEGVPVTGIRQRDGGGVRVDAGDEQIDADVALVTAGPWAARLLLQLGIEVALTPVLEQVTYVRGGEPPWQERPCIIDVPDSGQTFGLYAMPTPGIGFKVGIDEPIRAFEETSSDRSPDLNRESLTLQRVRQDLPGLDATLVRSEVCSWTSSPDGNFVLDRVGDVVFGCGDSGQGFKFLPMFGELLSDLVEARALQPDAAALGLARLVVD